MSKKINIFICVIFFGFFFQACKKFKEYTNFDVNYTTNFTIPASGNVVNLPIDMVTPETENNFQSEYDKNGTAAKLVDDVTLTNLNLMITSDGNFDFLNYIEVYLSTSNQSEILVASKYNIPETGLKILELNTGNDNLKNYVQDESFKIRIKAMTDKALTREIAITSNETFHVKAKLKNLLKK